MFNTALTAVSIGLVIVVTFIVFSKSIFGLVVVSEREVGVALERLAARKEQIGCQIIGKAFDLLCLYEGSERRGHHAQYGNQYGHDDHQLDRRKAVHRVSRACDWWAPR